MREDADSLSMAFLLLLARLSPVERAVFLLHEVFDYGYDEISPIIGKSEDNCRQLAVRARRHVNEHKPRFEASRQQRDRLADQFFDAVEDGDMNGLIELLAADVVVYGDGGGHSPSWRRPSSVAKRFSGCSSVCAGIHTPLGPKFAESKSGTPRARLERPFESNGCLFATQRTHLEVVEPIPRPAGGENAVAAVSAANAVLRIHAPAHRRPPGVTQPPPSSS